MTEVYRVEVRYHEELRDPSALATLVAARNDGLSGLTGLACHRVYLFAGEATPTELGALARGLLIDPMTQSFVIGAPTCNGASPAFSVRHRPGTSEPILHSLEAALSDLYAERPAAPLRAIGTARRYVFEGAADAAALDEFAQRSIYNPLAECLGEPGLATTAPVRPASHAEVPLDPLTDAELVALSKRLGLALDRTEMRALRAHFRTLGRAPTDIELETFAQTWSEHCVHKTFKAKIFHGDQVLDDLLAATVARATTEIDAPYCVSVFKDNAGIVRFDEDFDLCFKGETHNHPSAIAPYGGSATGLGGVIRDILGAGLGARPILGIDVFCVGPLDLSRAELPAGTHHPRRVLSGVVAGLRDYGNRIGIPTAAGGLYFGAGYVANPVVLAGCLGVMPRGTDEKSIHPGDYAVLVGGATGRDGIHGVTFSSESLNSESEELDRSAVQIGDPIVEQVIIEPLLRARDLRLYRSITDCGGGGLSSALGEMAEELGILVDLDTIPLKEPGLTPSEIWISESQERMVLAVPPERYEELAGLFASEDVPCTRVGHFTGDGLLRLRAQGCEVARLDIDFLHNGLPRRELTSRPPQPRRDLSAIELPVDPPSWPEALLGCLAHVNVRSKHRVIRQYDHEVQGRTVRGPFAGPHHGPQDAVVILPRLDRSRAAVVGLGFNPLQSPLDCYRMAANGIDEAVRNVVAVGGDPDRLSLLDNFIWGDVNDQDELGKLVEAAIACRDLAIGFAAPFISGKDSLNNTHVDANGEKRSITPTLIISALTMLDDAAKSVSMDLKEPGHQLFLLGQTLPELGGSVYFDAMGLTDGVVPEVDANAHMARARALYAAINAGEVRACHDCSEGGVLTALAEMALAGGLGAELELGDVAPEWRDDVAMFSESSGRYVVAVATEHRDTFAERFAEAGPITAIGRVTREPTLTVERRGERDAIAVSLCTEAWFQGEDT